MLRTFIFLSIVSMSVSCGMQEQKSNSKKGEQSTKGSGEDAVVAVDQVLKDTAAATEAAKKEEANKLNPPAAKKEEGGDKSSPSAVSATYLSQVECSFSSGLEVSTGSAGIGAKSISTSRSQCRSLYEKIDLRDKLITIELVENTGAMTRVKVRPLAKVVSEEIISTTGAVSTKTTPNKWQVGAEENGLKSISKIVLKDFEARVVAECSTVVAASTRVDGEMTIFQCKDMGTF